MLVTGLCEDCPDKSQASADQKSCVVVKQVEERIISTTSMVVLVVSFAVICSLLGCGIVYFLTRKKKAPAEAPDK